MYADIITNTVLGEDWSEYDQKKTAAGTDPALFTCELWEVHFLDNLLQDARAYEGDQSILAAIYLSCAEVKYPRKREDLIRHVVEKLMA